MWIYTAFIAFIIYELMKIHLNEETFKELLNKVVEYREKILIGTGIVVVALIALVYYSNSQKGKLSDKEVQFVQGFYALQFGDTLNAPALLLRVHSSAKGTRIGSYAGLTLGIYYYQKGNTETARQVLDASRKLDKLSRAAREVVLGDIAIDRGNFKAGLDKFDYKSGFKSVDEYLKYRKAKILMAQGNMDEAISILRELKTNGLYFSETASMELRMVGENAF